MIKGEVTQLSTFMETDTEPVKKETPKPKKATPAKKDTKTTSRKDGAKKTEPDTIPTGYVLKPEPKSKRTSILLKPSVYEKLTEKAEAAGTSINNYICELLEKDINK